MNEDGLIQKLKALGLTQQELGDRIGVSQRLVSAVFRKERQPGKKFLAGVLREFPELGLDVMEYLEAPAGREDQE